MRQPADLRPGNLAGPGAARLPGAAARPARHRAVHPPQQAHPGRPGTPQQQADYLAHFRADSIVRDAELIREEVGGGRPWSVLGQSFGGFCTVSYLSIAPGGLREAFITGGLPGLHSHPDDVYRLTYPAVARQTRAHYARYPQDVGQAQAVARYLRDHDVQLPGGAPLTVPGFQALGRVLGNSTGSDTLHYLLEDPFAGGELSDSFRYQVAGHLTFAEMPLYAVLHEACYAQGAATRWSAERIRGEFPEFDPAAAADGAAPLMFTGEMIYPWMLTADPVLRPLRAAADEIARREPWPALYDPDRLAANEVPVAAAIYYDDMYVPQQFSTATAAAIRGLRPWVTNEYAHDGLRENNGAVLDRLIALARGHA